MTKKQSTPAALTLEQAYELIHKFLDRIAELEARLNQHGGNASKPPSSDGPSNTLPARPRQACGKSVAPSPATRGSGGSDILTMPASVLSPTIRHQTAPVVLAR